MKHSKFVIILVISFLLCCFVFSPLSIYANGGGIYSYGLSNSFISSDLVVTKDKSINVSFSSEFTSYIKGDFYLYIVPFFQFEFDGVYFDDVYSYCRNNYLYTTKLSQSTTSYQIDSSLIFSYAGNYVIYALNPDEDRGASWNFIYSDSFSLDKNLTAGDYSLYIVNSVSDQEQHISTSVSANNFLNYSITYPWLLDSDRYGSSLLTMEDIQIKDLKGKPLLFAFDDLSISKVAIDGSFNAATYIIYVSLFDSRTSTSYPLGIIDNMHGGSSPGSPSYFLIDFNNYPYIDPEASFSLEFSFRVYAMENVEGNNLHWNISNFRFASITYGNTSNISDIVSALNDPSFGSFENPLDDSKIDSSSGKLDDAVGDYSNLENDLISSSDVDVSYYGDPLGSLTDSFSWWSQALTSIYVGVPLFESVIGLCVTVGLFAVIVGIGGRSVSNYFKNKKGDDS